jgi:photosystem II stability/assembly factor-like uncharacterized protein
MRSIIRWRVWSAWLVAGLIATLAGCVSTKPLEAVPTLQSLSGRGAAVLRVAFDRNPETGDTETEIVSVRVDRVSAEGTHRARLVRSLHGSYFSATLGGTLEPGTYVVYGVEMIWAGEKRFHRFAEDALRFEVRPDSISVVGTVVISREGADPVYLSPQADEAAQWVGQAFPVTQKPDTRTNYSPKVSTKLPTPSDAGDELKRRAQATASWIQLPSGDFAAPGRLGTVLYRHRASSRVEAIDVGAWSTVLFVGAIKGGVVAAGEEGLLRFSADGRSGWRQLPGPARGAIRALQAFGDDRVAAMVRSGDQWRVFVTADLFGGQWRELATLFSEQSDAVQSPGSRPPAHGRNHVPPFVPFVVAVADKMLVVQFHGAYQVVDLPSGKLQSGSLESRVREVCATVDGAIAVMTRGSTSASLSLDGGASWAAMNTPVSAVLTAMRSRQTHYAIVSDSSGGQISGFNMQVSRDGGLNWTRTGAVPIRLGQAEKLWASVQNTLQIETSDGGVLESVDEGNTWVRLPQTAARN